MVSILKLQILRAGHSWNVIQYSLPVVLESFYGFLASTAKEIPKLFERNPSSMASSFGKIILKVIPSSHLCLSDSRRIMFPNTSRLLSSTPSFLTCLPPPTLIAKAIALRPPRMLPPLFFPSSYPMMNQKELWFRGKWENIQSIFLLISKVLCPLGSSTWFHETVVKNYSKPTSGKIQFLLESYPCASPNRF